MRSRRRGRQSPRRTSRARPHPSRTGSRSRGWPPCRRGSASPRAARTSRAQTGPAPRRVARSRGRGR
eukprot:1178906-Rhodomonas_salina.1